MATAPTETLDRASRARLQSFHELMQRRVHRVLLVSSLYDSFIMSEEGHLHETLVSSYLDLNVSHFPDLVRVPNATEALQLLGSGMEFDLVISRIQTGEEDAAELTHRLREAGYSVPVIALAYTSREVAEFKAEHETGILETGELERIFLWQGDVRILMAIVKCHEDRLNVPYDTGILGVPAILVVEDNIRFYSSFLPTIYTELFHHTHRMLSEDLGLSQRMMRMRARPKVLLCSTYEEAWDFFEHYEEQILGFISDFEFPMKGKLEKHAGLDLCRRALLARPGIRIVLQSSAPDNLRLAQQIGASFLVKGSPTLLKDLRELLVQRFGFGDFIFRGPDLTEIDRAHDLRTLAQKLETVPGESIAYHADRNHFSNWLKARTEIALAETVRPVKLTDFEDVEGLRQYLLHMINELRRERERTVIADFDRKRFEPAVSITRVGEGALGGKARGVAFANQILRSARIDQRFPDVDVYVPSSIVLGTQTFDEFLGYEWIRDFASASDSDREIEERFLAAPFPRQAAADLRAFLQRVRYPLAIRSSSLLEDSLAQPFAGVYRTYMLPNNDGSLDVRLEQLKAAVKRVYASTFSQKAKTYLSMTSFRLEEEKMAVMIQELVGVQHEDRFYPDFAGVARSHNFYPAPGHTAEDGVTAVALGMGQTVVDGSPCLRFCPKYPRQIISFSFLADALRYSQREFYALDLSPGGRDVGEVELHRYPLEVAERDGSLTWLGSTYSPDDDRIVDGISRPGVRLVSFAQVLKHGTYPLAELMRVLLEECSQGTGAPVEIEFAGNLARPGRRAQFAFLQLRPLALSREREQVAIGDVPQADLVCKSNMVLGNGLIDDVRDLVVVGAQGFQRQKSRDVALQVAHFDSLLRKEALPYLLVGVGRWGSADPSLGIPVSWNQIAGARVIVEAGFEDLKVAPSQGTHFFQNLTSCSVGYFTVNPDADEGYLDWDWLASLEAVEETEFVRHVRLEDPIVVKMSGRTSEGVILKPGRG